MYDNSHKYVGATGRPLTDVVAIGIGGSYLGARFVYEALRHDTEAASSSSAKMRRIRFLSNVDPVAVTAALEGLNPETTLVVIISKTFTTQETLLNARTVRQWLLTGMACADATESSFLPGKAPGHRATTTTTTTTAASTSGSAAAAASSAALNHAASTGSTAPVPTATPAPTAASHVRKPSGAAAAKKPPPSMAAVIEKHMVAVSTNVELVYIQHSI